MARAEKTRADSAAIPLPAPETSASAVLAEADSLPQRGLTRELFGRLSDQMRLSSPGSADRLEDLGRVALSEGPNPSEVIAWAGVDLFSAFDLRHISEGVGETRVGRLRQIASVADSIRNFLVFIPVTLTWVGLGKAGAVYATCRLPASSAATQAAQEQAQFLYLWQKGFTDTSLNCDVTRGHTYGLPLNSFGEVVQADFLVLALLVLLTALGQGVWAWHERERSTAAHAFVDDMRGLLIDCTRKLQIVRSVQDTGNLVLQASDNLLRVSTDFSKQAREMMANLDLRSREAERRLEELGSSYSQVAASAVAATQGLGVVLSQVATSADKLAAVSLGVRDDLAKGAAAMENSVQASSQMLGAVGGQLGSVTDAVKELDRNVRVLVHVDESAAAVRNETKTGLDQIVGQVKVLSDIHLAIVRVRDAVREERVEVPAPAWRMYGALLGGQLLVLLIGVGVLLFRPGLGIGDSGGAVPATTAPVASPARIPTPAPSPSVTAAP